MNAAARTAPVVRRPTPTDRNISLGGLRETQSSGLSSVVSPKVTSPTPVPTKQLTSNLMIARPSTNNALLDWSLMMVCAPRSLGAWTCVPLFGSSLLGRNYFNADSCALEYKIREALVSALLPLGLAWVGLLG